LFHQPLRGLPQIAQSMSEEKKVMGTKPGLSSSPARAILWSNRIRRQYCNFDFVDAHWSNARGAIEHVSMHVAKPVNGTGIPLVT
jgi:hypothetical protein